MFMLSEKRVSILLLLPARNYRTVVDEVVAPGTTAEIAGKAHENISNRT